MPQGDRKRIAFLAGLAVLVAACPCALVLSAPATAMAGIAVAARHGILIRSSAFLEELADLTSLVVDKTGTLTFGTLRLQAIDSPLEDRSHVLAVGPGRQEAGRLLPRQRPSPAPEQPVDRLATTPDLLERRAAPRRPAAAAPPRGTAPRARPAWRRW